MRWVFFVLLGMNAVYFGWQRLAERAVVEPVVVRAESIEQALTDTQSIRLLTELKNEGKGVLRSRQHAEMCSVFGPFFTRNRAVKLLEYIASEDIPVRIRNESVKKQPFYWLYVSPRVSLRAAQEVVNQFRGSNVNAELINEGPLKNGVALGQYQAKAEVTQVITIASEVPVDVVTVKKSRDYEQFWVVVEPGGAEKMSEKLRATLLDNYPKIILQKNVCKSIAS